MASHRLSSSFSDFHDLLQLITASIIITKNTANKITLKYHNGSLIACNLYMLMADISAKNM